MQFNISNTIKTNITSSLDLRDGYDLFGLITYELAKNSSKYIYRLEIYSMGTLQKKQSIDIYQSYDVSKHFIKFIGNLNLVAVTTNFHLMFYQVSPLKLVKSILHQQSNVYDLEASKDGQLIVMIGQDVLVYRSNGLRKVVFPHIIKSARYASFSWDNKQMVVSSNNEINIYGFKNLIGEYQFNQLSSTSSPASYQDITSIQFSPITSSQMTVGFLNVSPQTFHLDTLTFSPPKDIQPQASSNAKKTTYMPDGKRFLSSDFLDGIGIWPGIKNQLHYEEGFLLYDLHPDSKGDRFIGYVWQQVKLVDIQTQCTPGNYSTSCTCQPNYIWDYSTYSCQPLVCLQSQFSTGATNNNLCVCLSGYMFNVALKKCIINCSAIRNTVPTIPSSSNSCYCVSNYSWDISNKTCTFNCQFIPHSNGILVSSQLCGCLPGFIWSSQYLQCLCPPYQQVLNRQCVCLDQYFQNQNGLCIIDCSKIKNSLSSLPSQQQCQCKNGYNFVQEDLVVGCKLNCTLFNNTQAQSPGFDTCLCIQNMNWDGNSNACLINCQAVGYASGQSLIPNQCNCASNYLWIEQIHECGKNCTSYANIDHTKKSTLRSCPCISKYNWNQQTNQCQVDCTLVNNTSPWSQTKPFDCECRQSFTWVQSQSICQINCSKIWNGNQRQTDYSCSCNNDQIFNQKALTCDAPSASSFFSNTWTIVGFVLGILLILFICAFLIRFCWNFSTSNNKEHQKKLKTNDVDQDKKKRKTKKLLQGAKSNTLVQQHGLASEDRLGTKTTM